jgi:hypothetical protein
MPIFNDQGALEDGQEFRSAREGALIRAEDYVNSQPYFAPQNDREKIRFDRTMTPVMQDGVHQVNEANQPLYMTPEREVFLQNEKYLDAIQAKEDSDFERRVSNPFFKVQDFAADVFRNTVGLPINLITGDNGFHVDPSESAVEGYKGRLMELDQLRVANHKMFINGRDTRANAFAGAVTKTIGGTQNTADGVAVVVQRPDGTISSEYVPAPDGSGEPLRTQRFETVQLGNGVTAVIDRQDPTQPIRYLNSVDDIAEGASTIAEQTAVGGARGEAIGDAQVNLRSVVDGANQVITTVNKIRNHPALDAVFNNWMGGLNPKLFAANTPERDLAELLEQATGTVFLQGFKAVKGGGQITEIEGQKAEVSLANLDKAQTKGQFMNGLEEFLGVVVRGAKDAELKARGDFTSIPQLDIEGSGFAPRSTDIKGVYETPNGNSYEVVE